MAGNPSRGWLIAGQRAMFGGDAGTLEPHTRANLVIAEFRVWASGEA